MATTDASASLGTKERTANKVTHNMSLSKNLRRVYFVLKLVN